jgi:hypothetical protein
MHRFFDKRWLVIVPKVPGDEVGTEVGAEARAGTYPFSQYVTHILSGDAAELWPTFHNTLVQYLDDRSRPYLFARFAWAVILHVKPFITLGTGRYVVRIHTDNNGKVEQKTEFVGGPLLRSGYGGGGSKAATPMKRRAGAGILADDNDSFTDSSSEDSDSSMDWGMRSGNRKSQQMSSEETAPDPTDLEEALLKGMVEQRTTTTSRDIELSLPANDYNSAG